MFRSRILKINNKIIITNYKCMFSAINKLPNCKINSDDINTCEKIMLYRNPVNRTVSCF